MKSFLPLVLAALPILLHAQETPDIFQKPVALVSALPGHPVLVLAEGRCIVSSARDADPVWFKIVPGILDRKAISLEAVAAPGSYLRHQDWRCVIAPFKDDDDSSSPASTFNLIVNSDGTYSLEAATAPNCYAAVLPSNSVRLVVNPDSLRRSFTLKTE